eukprot:scaffold1796_cov60-Cyclotella_meneghiniana.AAC.8
MPRLPHRLVKPPTQMSMPELAVFGALGVSITLGLLQMGSETFAFYKRGNSEEQNESSSPAVCPMNWGKKGEQ